jgi:hypothetical protein
MRFYPRLEHYPQPSAPRSLFAKRLALNFAVALAVILASLFAGMLGYRYFEGLRWLDSFSHAAMILGGMGPYVEPKSDVGKLFEGFYALYSGLLLIGVTGLILAPIFHRVMRLYQLPDENDSVGSPKRTQRSSGAKRGGGSKDSLR